MSAVKRHVRLDYAVGINRLENCTELLLRMPAGSAALRRMTSAWRDAPVAGTLSQKVGQHYHVLTALL